MAKKGLNRKGSVLLAKVFSESIDGKFDYDENHQWKSIYGRRYDRTYLKYRLEDEILKKANNNSVHFRNYKTEYEDIYIVMAIAKENSKLYNGLKDMGFTEVKKSC